ncbi:hypothetical protein FACS1894147_03200 [Spirochaetia bacterium]|nr:hypothetical protein FACS1894147_03200 [Spirochaetia bacterium]
MEKKRNIFNIFPRKLKNGTVIFYYYIYDTNGKRKQYSTGKQTESDAYQECLRLVKLNQLNRHSSLSFRKYCVDWFDYEKCDYIKIKLLHGFTYSKTYAKQLQGQLKKHAFPFFADKPLDTITATDIEAYIRHLKNKGLSNTSVNHSLKMLRVIFGWAKRKNILAHNPMNEIINLKSDTKEKGMFTENEAASLLLGAVALETVWEGNETMYLLNLTAYKTGMRLGELQALRKEDIQAGYITVRHSFDRKYGLKSTKTGKVREIPIAMDLQEKLRHHTNRIFGDYIFGVESGTRPVRHDEILQKRQKYLIDLLALEALEDITTPSIAETPQKASFLSHSAASWPLGRYKRITVAQYN